MNKRQIVASLNSIANELDTKGLFKEANEVTEVMVRISQYSGLRPGSPAANAVGVTPPVATGAGSSVATPGFIAVNDSKIYRDAMALIESHLGNGDPKSASDEYLKGLKNLKSDESKAKFTKQWNRTRQKYGIGNLTEEPVAGETPVANNVPVKPAPSQPGMQSTPSKPGKPTSKPSKPGMSSKPGSTNSSTPKSAEGLDRWVNKAENIYNAWGSKGANPNSSAFGLVKDIVDYMDKVKSNLPTSLHSAADVKIARVQEMLRNIFDGAYNPALALTPLPYGVMSGYPKKGVNPFTTGPKMTEKQLNYQARNEGKSY